MEKFIKLNVKNKQVGRGHFDSYYERYFNIKNISFSDCKVFENNSEIEVKEKSIEILKLINNE